MERTELKTPSPCNDQSKYCHPNESELVKSCPSTDCDWKFDLLRAPRPRARTRLNESGLFEQDTESVAKDQHPKQGVVDMIYEDWAAAGSYSDEIFSYLYSLEDQFLLPKDFLAQQTEVTYESRAVLVDWLIQVHEFYNFPLDCLYLMISLLDRYMSLQYVPLTNFQLLGMACLLVACKYEDRFVPRHDDLVSMADKAFSGKELSQMEKLLLESLNYDLSLPLPSHFLRRFARAAVTDAETYTLAKFLLEISKLDLMLVTYKPSLVAASAFCLARGLVLENTKLSDSVPSSFYSLDQLKPCLVGFAKVLKIVESLGCKGVIKKYCRLGINSSVIEYLSQTPLVNELLSCSESCENLN